VSICTAAVCSQMLKTYANMTHSAPTDLGTMLPPCSAASQSLLSGSGAEYSSGAYLTVPSTLRSYTPLNSGAIAGDLSHIGLFTGISPNARPSGQSALTSSSSSATNTGQLSVLPAPGVKPGSFESLPTPYKQLNELKAVILARDKALHANASSDRTRKRKLNTLRLLVL
jgi:hypothetical protein